MVRTGPPPASSRASCGIRVASGLATTGVAGPDEQEGKPPGTVFVAAVGPDGSPVVRELSLTGDRGTVRRRTVVHALDLVRRVVLGLPTESPAAPRR